MSIPVRCSGCGKLLIARVDFAGRRGECPFCGSTVEIPGAAAPSQIPPDAVASAAAGGSSRRAAPSEIKHYLDPPSSPHPSTTADADAKPPVFRRMFEALLQPRSIQWMLMIGGGLCVLGLIVWLVSLGVFENPRVLAAVLGVGTLAILGTGWWVALGTRYRIAGQALTFLGCVVAPLNLWFYHAQNLVTVDGHLWVGGVVCCLLYAATVVVLRDPLFMYACEVGVTLTTLLLLADMGRITDAAWLSLFCMALGLTSIHAERAFSPAPDSDFPRRRFGLPLFWSGHAQIGASLVILLGSQLLKWLTSPAHELFGLQWTGNLLTENYLIAAGVWLAGVYAYLYSDIVVRKVGVYLALAGVSLVMAEVTLLLGYDVRPEWIIAAMAVTSVAINVIHQLWAGTYPHLDRFVPPVGWLLGIVPVVWGIILHLRATSAAIGELDWAYNTDGQFVAVMLIVAFSNRVNAYLCRHADPRSFAAYLFLSAASLLVAAAGLLRVLGLIEWSQQAPWMMLVPIGYLIASRLWRGHSTERPLYWIAQTATAVILIHVLAATLDTLSSFAPMEALRSSLMLGLVFAEATIFYLLAGLLHRRSNNIYLAAAAACGALWQFMGYYGIDDSYYTMLYAVLGVACLIVGRSLGLDQVTAYQAPGNKTLVTRGRGLAAYQSGNGILLVASLAAIMQGLAGLATRPGEWLDVLSLLVTTGAAALAAAIVPTANWRRIYASVATALAAMMFLRLNLLVDLSGWQKLEIFCVVVGLAMLVASHLGWFRELAGKRNETVDLGLGLGSILAAVPLVIAVFYHRWANGQPSLYDEMALLTVTILMVVTGLSWQIRATTLWGGASLILYLIVLVASLAYRPQIAIGVYMAVGGAVVFAVGIVLSVYRDRLLEIPDRVAKREGVFRILSWR